MEKCDWGYSTASVDMYGNLTRCAVASPNKTNLLGNILETLINEIWQNNETLNKFRNKEYVEEECKNCDLLSKCGSGCAISCGDDMLSTDILKKSLIM